MNLKEKIPKFIKDAYGKVKDLFKGEEKEEKTKKEKVKQEAFDWIISISVALLIYFVILPALLGTSSPLIVVSSCSEEPYLNIGDVLILQGTDIESTKAPTVNVENGLNYSFNEEDQVLTINGKKIRKNDSNDIVVYISSPSGSQVIHRALAKLDTGKEKLLLTWGDANSLPDQLTRAEVKGERALCMQSTQRGTVLLTPNNTQYLTKEPGACISTPVNKDRIVGEKATWRIPILGHFKLFFCDVMPFCDGHSNPGTGYDYELSC